jgi:aspartate racemase
MGGPARSGKVVGVIGGMGPAATIHFMTRVMALTPAVRDQDHLRLIVDNNGALPDRNAAVCGDGPSPGPILAEMARGLERAGAQLLVMPCNTAHAFAEEVRAAASVPFLDLVEITCDAALAGGPDKVGVLAADGCIEASLYQGTLGRRGVQTLLCSPPDQSRFMGLLWRIKAGDLGPAVRAEMRELTNALVAAGAQVVVAGCTEVPLVIGSRGAGPPLIDSIETLARATIAAAKGTS